MEVLSEINSVNQEKITIGDRSIEKYSSGRIEIWRAYLQHVTFWGHSLTDDFEYERNGKISNRGTAHMTFLQNAFEYGAPSAIFMLLFHITAAVKCVLLVFRSKDFYAGIPIIFAIAYGSIASLATINALSQPISLIYFLFQAPLMFIKDTDSTIANVETK